ncbi:MAG: helix-turn-helix domain-containing protein [Caldilineaceae bacterium]
MSDRLRQWMDLNGYGNTDLARELSFTREFVWQVANGKREVTGEFRWRFAERFGWAEAQALFGAQEGAVDVASEPA